MQYLDKSSSWGGFSTHSDTYFGCGGENREVFSFVGILIYACLPKILTHQPSDKNV